MTALRPFIVVELDLPVCANTYGVAPCTAEVGYTGSQKCFNTLRTCQDRPNFTPATKTLRLCDAAATSLYDAIPCLLSVDVTPGMIDPGRSIGVRGKVKVEAEDFPTGDALLDKYIAERTYDPWSQGTFWPKLRARFASLQGVPLRVLRGELGAALNTFRVEHYFVESSAIDASGVSITAKDALSFCDPKKAQCPVLSKGRLAAEIDDNDTSWSLVPAGIGDLEYPEEGVACLGGKELVEYTRSGDTITLVGLRGAYGTEPQSHDEDSVFQQVVFFDGMSAADIVYELLTVYTPGVDAAWCDLTAWQAEADLYIGHLYHAILVAPTAVKTLLDEMCVQAGLSIWWDPEAEQIRFQSLRPTTPAGQVLDESRILRGSFKSKEQPDKRLSQHWTYYGLSNPTNKVDKEPNFKAAVARVDVDAEVDYGAPAFGQVLARWISIANRPAAERLNEMKLTRFRDPPRSLAFSLFPNSPYLPTMGTSVPVQDYSLQNADGSRATVRAFITSREDSKDEIRYTAEEVIVNEDSLPGTDRAVFIDVDGFNINLRTLYDSLYSSVPYGAVITFTLSPGAWVGGQIVGGRSIIVGDWPEVLDGAASLVFVVGAEDNSNAQVLGRGGNGGGYPGSSVNASDGEDGGTALYTRVPITVKNYGRIAGGGGGGQGLVGAFGEDPTFYATGAGAGAGFSGYTPGGSRRGGLGGQQDGTNGGTVNGGTGATKPNGTAGNGGDLAQGGFENSENGGSADHTSGGAAVDGVSFVTFDPEGDVIGPQIN